MSASQLRAQSLAMVKVAEKLEKNAKTLRKQSDKLNLLATKSKSGRGPGRPRGRLNEIPLPDLILSILSRNKPGLELKEIVQKCYDSGYQSNGISFPNIVYQALRKLVGRKVVHKRLKKYVSKVKMAKKK